MSEPKMTDPDDILLASQYDRLADDVSANPDITPGLAAQIARVSKATAAELRKGPGRPFAVDPKSVVLSLRVTPAVSAWIEEQGGLSRVVQDAYDKR